MSSQIKVFVRVRPPIPEDMKLSEKQEHCTQVLESDYEPPVWFPFNTKFSPMIKLNRGQYEQRQFKFDHIFDQYSTQQQVYEISTTDLINDILNGVNRTVFTYGQTGSGKTFTLFGPPSEPLLSGKGNFNQLTQSSGLLPRIIINLFEQVAQLNIKCNIELSYIQIYKDQVFDLLQINKYTEKQQKLQFQNMQIPQMTKIQIDSPQQIFQLIAGAVQQRVIAATQMNAASSRSHTLLILKVETDQNFKSLLTLCDLAGSERVNKTLSTGERLEEAKKINQSLSCLGKCVVALASKQKFVPFRDCNLTKILFDSLTGNCKTTLIATVGPLITNYDESNSTLQFAARCMNVSTTPQQNIQKYHLTQSGVKFDCNIEMTVLGQFGVDQQGCGFVRCQCPRCGVNLVVLDGAPVDQNEAVEEIGQDDAVSKEQLEHSGGVVREFQATSTKSGKCSSQIHSSVISNNNLNAELIKSLQQEIQLLRRENKQQSQIIEQFTQSLCFISQNAYIKQQMKQLCNIETVDEQDFDQNEQQYNYQSETPSLQQNTETDNHDTLKPVVQLNDQHFNTTSYIDSLKNSMLEQSRQQADIMMKNMNNIVNSHLPPPHPMTFQKEKFDQELLQPKIQESNINLSYQQSMENTRQASVNNSKQVQFNDDDDNFEPNSKLIINPQTKQSLPITVQPVYQPFAMPKPIQLKKDYPKVVYDSKTKTVRNAE